MTEHATKTPQPEAPTRWLSSQIKIILVTVAAVALLTVAVMPWYLSSPGTMSRIVFRLVPELRADVQFDRVRLGWLGPIRLDGIRVAPRDGSTPPLVIRGVEISNGLAAILFTGGDLGRLRVDGLEADVVADAERHSNLAALFAPGPDASQTPPSSEDAPRRRRSLVSLRLEIDDARVRIAGPWSPDPWVSDPIDIRATLGPAERGWHSEWAIEPVQLLTHAKLEPSVAQGVLAYIAPVLADATRTGGEFSLRLNGATLPVGDPVSGTLAGVLSMHRVDLGPGPLAIKTIQELPMRLPPPPVVRLADEATVDFRLGDRRIWHTGLEFGIPLKQPGLRLDVHSSGSVGLDDDSLDLKLELPIPADLPQDRPLIASLAGRKISVGVAGTLDDPKLVFNGSIRETAGEVVAEILERLKRPDSARQQPSRSDAEVVPHGEPPVDANARSTRPPSPDDEQQPTTATNEKIESLKSKLPPELTKDPTADAVIDLVGGVLEQVAKRRAERKAAEAAKSTGQKERRRPDPP